MSISPIPLSSLKKDYQIKSQINNYSYHLYECVYLLRVKKFQCDIGNELEEQNQIDIKISSLYEGNGRSLLVLVCSNGSLLLYMREDEECPVTKQLNWFQNPSKRIVALCVDPLRGAWILCACKDSSLYLIPALAQLKDTVKLVNASPTWSQTDLSRIPFSKPPKGRPTCVVWWHTLDDRNVGIVGTESGELIFLDISRHQEITRTAIKEKIVKLELSQDINERTSYVLIYTVKNWTLQLLLEQPSKSAEFNPPSSLTQAYDMGYDMVADCNVDSILFTTRIENKEEIQLTNRTEVLPQDFKYCIHHINDSALIGKHDTKYNALEIFSDIRRVPEYVYHVTPNCIDLLLCENFMFTVTKNDNQISLNVVSRQLSATSFNRQGLKKPDPSRKAEIQMFKLLPGEEFLNCYKVHFKRPVSWKDLFPHKDGYKDECHLSSFFIVTKDGVLECRPCISPEHYFTELAAKTGIEVAEKIGVTLDLNISLLCEFLADKLIREKEIQTAVKFYNRSKCPAIKRATQLVEFSNVTESLIYIKQVLKKQPTSLSAKERKQLSNMTILCYVEQALESQRSGTFSKNLADSFKSFIYDNFDYDEQLAMDLLASYGLIDNLFEVAKTRGRISDALDKLSSCGLFMLTRTVQHMLLDCGYGDVICKASNGVFIQHMKPEDAAKFLLAQPDVTKKFINIVSRLLLKVEESTLLQIARVFDPSRQFIKPILEKVDSNRRKRSNSSLSLNSTTSTIVDDPTLPTTSDIIVVFLKSIIALNSRRKGTALPDLKLISRHLSGQLSWSNSIYMRSDSMGSNELLVSEMSRVKVACGRHHLAFVTGDKELYTWGRASFGRLGHGDLVEERSISQPMRVESLHMHGIQVLSVACGALHTIALCQEGVFAWGSNKHGQLGVGDTRKRSRPVLLSDLSSKQVNSIVCGQYHSLAVTTDYKAFSWGWGVHGQLGLKCNENQVTPQFIHLLKGHRVIQIAGGYAHSAVLTSRGQVFTFGAGLYGQLGIGVNTKRTTPQLVESLAHDSIYLIACGSFETLAVSEDQTIFCWGRNYHQFHICGKAESASYGRQMASNTTDISHRYLPEDLPFKLQQPIIQLICGNWHYMALTSMNYVYTWGCNDCGQLGHYNKIEQPAPRLVKALSRRSVVGVAAGSEFSLCVDSEDQVLAWGRSDGGLIGIENDAAPTTSVARRSVFSVLAPTPVPGLPIHFDQVSVDSTQSLKREFMFDQNYDLPDLSTVGHDQAPYSCEAVLVSLSKLKGLYDLDCMGQYALRTKQWFVLSFCYELDEKWDKAFGYRAQSIQNYYRSNSHDVIDQYSYFEKMFLVVADFLNKFEDRLSEDLEEDCSLVAMVTCLNAILQYWRKEDFNFRRLEDLLRKHLESLCPLYTIVFFGHLGTPNNVSSPTLRFALYHVTKQNALFEKFSDTFFIDMLSQVTTQMDSGSNWYNFLSSSEDQDVIGYTDMCLYAPVEETTLSRDEMLREIIEHKRKILSIKPYISLSNAVAATLAAASIAHQVQSDMDAHENKSYKQLSIDEPDSTVFTCNHNLPRYYMLETVIPEFQSRMNELPESLVNTAEAMAKFYKAADIRIPMACPYCVYNNLRNEQLHVLRETGADIINDRSTVWEI
ncbi:uncharacterized protein LOC130624943 isoform X2 [Hydractinia symbiolongicarpus]|uniref:uncharacterized protein LOC130624943 isoform X2 n=1 Tax=Hydractinia symbiolongicarpus TaxID=13093 RepID=UPI00254D12C2|nr:uncharacterized protein LOC130624943 isoform X2 [Hydractinia symbiolongicarpus]